MFFSLYNKTEEFNQLLEESDDIHRRRQEATEMLKVFKKNSLGEIGVEVDWTHVLRRREGDLGHRLLSYIRGTSDKVLLLVF